MAWFKSVFRNFRSPHYVVLVGDVGTGKSTLVEKLTGEKGRSSDANESFTKTSETFWVRGGRLIMIWGLQGQDVNKCLSVETLCDVSDSGRFTPGP